MIVEQAAQLLRKRTFVSVATADKSCEPHAAPKFVYKMEGDTITLVDHAIARTADNLRANPRACVSFMDLDNFEGYRMTGDVELLESGAEFDSVVSGFDKRLLKLSTDRFIEGMKAGKPTEHFEIEINPAKMIVYKIKVREAVRIGRQGDLFRESVS